MEGISPGTAERTASALATVNPPKDPAGHSAPDDAGRMTSDAREPVTARPTAGVPSKAGPIKLFGGLPLSSYGIPGR
jgi:hypothetical protein